MQRTASDRFFFTDSSSLERADERSIRIGHRRFYQEIALQLTKRRSGTEELLAFADQLVSLATHLYSFRQMDRLEAVSNYLSNLPLPAKYTQVGHYYHALCLKRSGNLDAARLTFEQVASKAPLAYRARAMMSTGVIAFEMGDAPTALKLSIDACKASSNVNGGFDPLTRLMAERNICVITSLDGDHQGALEGLQRLLPLAQVLGPSGGSFLFEHLNSLAVELMEVGRLEEAANASRIAMASPYAPAYPEWHETRNDIFARTGRPSRSAVGMSRQLIDSDERATSDSMPVEGVTIPLRPQGPASVLLFPSRHEQPSPPPARPAKITSLELARMSVSQKRALLLAQAQCADTSEATYDRLLHAAGLVIDKDPQNRIDLESASADRLAWRYASSRV